MHYTKQQDCEGKAAASRIARGILSHVVDQAVRKPKPIPFSSCP